MVLQNNNLQKELYAKGKSILYTDIVGLITNISDYIMKSEKKIKEGVKKIVGGKVLELESERLMKKAKVELAITWVADNIVPISKAAQQMGMTEEEFMKAVQDYKKMKNQNN